MNAIVQDVVAFARNDAYGPMLRKILEFEDRVAAEGGWHTMGTYDGRPLGWEAYEVGLAPAHLVRLRNAGIVNVSYKSTKQTQYRLADADLVRRALAGELLGDAPEERALAPEIPADLFAPIVGYDDVKDLFRRSLASARPAPILLEGPPASAKTLFLMEIGRLPNAYFATGGNLTKAGLSDLLISWRPRYLLLDEIETIDNARDYSVLLHLMENGEVIETKYRRHVRIPLVAWVFGAGNATSSLPGPLKSRFGRPLRFKAYTPEEFVDVAAQVLVVRENLSDTFAHAVATATLELGSRDVR